MKIGLTTVGTRGDVQPYIAVAHALMERGHQVVIIASEGHEDLVAQYGIEFRPLPGNFKELMLTDLGRAWLNSGDSPRKYARYVNELFLPLQRPACEAIDAALHDCDGVAFYMMAYGAMHAAERRKIPVVAMAPWPMVPTRDYAPLPAPWAWGWPGFLKKWLGDFLVGLMFGSLTGEHQAHRASVGLPPFPRKDLFHYVIGSGIQTVQLFSGEIFKRPSDWEERHQIVGFAFAPSLSYTPPPELEAFLAKGDAIYLGFGSMTGFSPEELAKMASEAARLAGVRAVVASGWAGLQIAPTDDLFVIDEVPHDWLFPRVSAVAHHGGIGTFAEGLRWGKPTVIAAFFADQPYWGKLNQVLGTGPKHLMREKITAQNLAKAIREALDGPYRARAEELGAKIRAENGAARAAEAIERALGVPT